ncbi:MAG: hypothetical protein JSS61_06275 [Verrucomicrobia bacterium]|nr:hypothetical protein [Verrucomicrobiota bacterium]
MTTTQLRRDPLAYKPVIFSKKPLGIERPSFLIQPSYSLNGISHLELAAYIGFIDETLRTILPKEVLDRIEDSAVFSQFLTSLPLLLWNDPQSTPCTLCVSTISAAKFSMGVLRYMCDTLSRWLIPGKLLNISSVHSLDFNFIAQPDEPLFFHQILLDISSDLELAIARSMRESLEREIRLSILTVRHARQVVSVKQLTSEQKNALIQENIASILNVPSPSLGNNAFDQIHHFLLNLTAEEKIQKIQEQFTPLLEQRPEVFDRNIFNEIRHMMHLFGDQFTALRDLRYVSRLISFQYLFRRRLMHIAKEAPEERLLSLKLLKTHLQDPLGKKQKRPVLGVLGAIHITRENELFEERHIYAAIRNCLPAVKTVENSFILDRRSHDPIRLFYLEIENEEGHPFSLEEIRELQKHLPRELKENVESVLHPVFMPRNEEEIMRNILLLSAQLNYLNDLPQVIISFHAQSEEKLFFTVILLRILRGSEKPIASLFQQGQTILESGEVETKRVGLLRKRYPKEANVFQVSLPKKQFLRNFSVDLFKARHAVSSELHRLFDGIRDFNGGILAKQQEVFQELQGMLKERTHHKDFLLENFFYSLTPPLRQSLLMPSTLEILFQLMLEALEVRYDKERFILKTHFGSNELLVMAASPQSGFKEEVFSLITSLQIPAAELSYSYVNSHGIHCVGYIYQNRDPSMRTLFYSTLLTRLQEWQ